MGSPGAYVVDGCATRHPEARVVPPSRIGLSVQGARLSGARDPAECRLLEDRDKVFYPRKHERVELGNVVVLRNPLVGLTSDRWERKVPPEAKGLVPAPESYAREGCGPNPERPGLAWRGTASEPVPVTGLAANFSPIPRIAPPPLGSERVGLWRPGAAPGELRRPASPREVSRSCRSAPKCHDLSTP